MQSLHSQHINEIVLSPYKLPFSNLLMTNHHYSLEYAPLKTKQFLATHPFVFTPASFPQTPSCKYKRTDNLDLKTTVQSAQKSRNISVGSSHKFRMSYHFHNCKQSSNRSSKGDQNPEKNQMNLRQIQLMPSIGKKTIQTGKQSKRHIKALSFALQPKKNLSEDSKNPFLSDQSCKERYYHKSSMPTKKFTENLKNRRKLTERLTHGKTVENKIKGLKSKAYLQESIIQGKSPLHQVQKSTSRNLLLLKDEKTTQDLIKTVYGSNKIKK